MTILAIDPGSRWTALVVRQFGRNLDATVRGFDVLDRRQLTKDALPFWLERIRAAARHLDEQHHPDSWAVEAAGAPNPHLGMTNPEYIIDTAAVVGTVLATGWDDGQRVDLVPPGSYGAPVPNRRILTKLYPPDLYGPRETTGSGKGKLQHARAAYDIAAAAYRQLRHNVQ